jgi:hypothetical protein
VYQDVGNISSATVPHHVVILVKTPAAKILSCGNAMNAIRTSTIATVATYSQNPSLLENLLKSIENFFNFIKYLNPLF